MFTIKVFEGGGYTAYSTPAYKMTTFPDKATIQLVLFDLRTREHHELIIEVPEGREDSIAVYVENNAGKTIDHAEIYWNQVIR